MKKLTVILVALSIKASAQNIVPNKIDLHLSKFDHQYKTGKAFFYSGAVLMTASNLFLLSKSPDRVQYASAVGLIGGAFSVYGFFAILDSHRHEKRAWQGDRTARN